MYLQLNIIQKMSLKGSYVKNKNEGYFFGENSYYLIQTEIAWRTLKVSWIKWVISI